MKQRKPVIDKNKASEDLHVVRLMVLLQELVRDHGRKRAAAILGVDRRTLDAGLDERVLSRRMRTALDRALRSGVGSAPASERDHDDELEGRLKDSRGPRRGAGGECEQGAGSGPGRREGAQGRTRAVSAPGCSEPMWGGRPKTGSPGGRPRFGGSSPTW